MGTPARREPVAVALPFIGLQLLLKPFHNPEQHFNAPSAGAAANDPALHGCRRSQPVRITFADGVIGTERRLRD